jgi:hypothetical protein
MAETTLIVPILSLVVSLGQWLCENLPAQDFQSYRLGRASILAEMFQSHHIIDKLYYPNERQQWKVDLEFIKDQQAIAKALWERQQHPPWYKHCCICRNRTIKKTKGLMEEIDAVLGKLETNYAM